jgi:hypothetical protein
LLLVWPGPEGTVWVDDGAQLLLRFSVDGLKRIDRREVFAGQFHNVMPERNGNFWVATSAGVVHYAAPLWRPPAGGESIETPVHSIVEDRKGGMWFAGGAYLSRWDGKSWRRYFLPKGAQHTSFFLTTALCPLPDGKILVKTGTRFGPVLVFDPERGTFKQFTHPENRGLGILAPRPDGTVWIQTTGAKSTEDTPDYRLETYDGKHFTTVLDLGVKWNISELRYLFEARNGDLWLGGTDPDGGIALYRGGRYRTFSRADGFTANGAFAIYELPGGTILAGGRDKLMAYDGKSWKTEFEELDEVRRITRSARDGTIWVASSRGVHRYQHGAWITYAVEEGLPSSIAVTLFEDRQGQIWGRHHAWAGGVPCECRCRSSSGDLAPGTQFQRDAANRPGETRVFRHRQMEADRGGPAVVLLPARSSRVVSLQRPSYRVLHESDWWQSSFRGPGDGPEWKYFPGAGPLWVCGRVSVV